jgi:2-beta-glucuronyltransferase
VPANTYLVPHGVDKDLRTLGEHSPYGPGIHAVAVGSMLFDPVFFELAAAACPQVQFHVIGSGYTPPAPPARPQAGNVHYYPRMAFAATIRYIRHASIGIAPYGGSSLPPYLADSSLKMLQYDYFCLPTVCPYGVTASYANRFGYEQGDAASIQQAIGLALAAPHQQTRRVLTWTEVTERLLAPRLYADTRI